MGGQGIATQGWVDRLGGLVEKRKGLMLRLARWESGFLKDSLAEIELREPIYVSGLARSGSTILLEILNSHPATGSHQYRDFPPVFTPFWWNRYLDLTPTKAEEPAERAHKDRIRVTSESPEAMEEPLWMAHFPDCHEPDGRQVLNRAASHPEFEEFYLNHLKKVLLVRGKDRYLAKGNYNVTRLDYLFRLLPGARFIVPVRDPVAHVASLLKQHRLFREAGEENPKVTDHLRRVGHFEFGPGRLAVRVDDPEGYDQTLEFWAQGREAEGYARQWAMTYGYVAKLLKDNPDLADATLILRYEDLCADPERVLTELFDHARLPQAEEVVGLWAPQISPPKYYSPDLDPKEIEAVREITAQAAKAVGYSV